MLAGRLIVLRAFTLISAVLAASHASAQTDNHFALGIDFTTRHPPGTSSVADGTHDVGIVWRFGHSEEGWGWQYALNWYSMDVDRSLGGGPINLGALRVRPLMFGYGYSHLFGPRRRIAVTGDVVGGFAFTSFELAPAANDVYIARLGARSLTTHASGTMVAKPEVEIWYDVNRKVGLLVNAGYVFARPEVTVTSSLGQDVHRIHADTYILKIGVVYSIF